MAAQDTAGPEVSSGPEDPDDELLAQLREDNEATARVNAPAAFAFGEAPGSADLAEPVKKPRKTGSVTHTGTDPHGRAIGPAEDHTKAKRDHDGKTAAQAAGKDEQ